MAMATPPHNRRRSAITTTTTTTTGDKIIVRVPVGGPWCCPQQQQYYYPPTTQPYVVLPPPQSYPSPYYYYPEAGAVVAGGGVGNAVLAPQQQPPPSWNGLASLVGRVDQLSTDFQGLSDVIRRHFGTGGNGAQASAVIGTDTLQRLQGTLVSAMQTGVQENVNAALAAVSNTLQRAVTTELQQLEGRLTTVVQQANGQTLAELRVHNQQTVQLQGQVDVLRQAVERLAGQLAAQPPPPSSGQAANRPIVDLAAVLERQAVAQDSLDRLLQSFAQRADDVLRATTAASADQRAALQGQLDAMAQQVRALELPNLDRMLQQEVVGLVAARTAVRAEVDALAQDNRANSASWQAVERRVQQLLNQSEALLGRGGIAVEQPQQQQQQAAPRPAAAADLQAIQNALDANHAEIDQLVHRIEQRAAENRADLLAQLEVANQREGALRAQLAVQQQQLARQRPAELRPEDLQAIRGALDANRTEIDRLVQRVNDAADRHDAAERDRLLAQLAAADGRERELVQREAGLREQQLLQQQEAGLREQQLQQLVQRPAQLRLEDLEAIQNALATSRADVQQLVQQVNAAVATRNTAEHEGLLAELVAARDRERALREEVKELLVRLPAAVAGAVGRADQRLLELTAQVVALVNGNDARTEAVAGLQRQVAQLQPVVAEANRSRAETERKWLGGQNTIQENLRLLDARVKEVQRVGTSTEALRARNEQALQRALAQLQRAEQAAVVAPGVALAAAAQQQQQQQEEVLGVLRQNVADLQTARAQLQEQLGEAKGREDRLQATSVELQQQLEGQRNRLQEAQGLQAASATVELQAMTMAVNSLAQQLEALQQRAKQTDDLLQGRGGLGGQPGIVELLAGQKLAIETELKAVESALGGIGGNLAKPAADLATSVAALQAVPGQIVDLTAKAVAKAASAATLEAQARVLAAAREVLSGEAKTFSDLVKTIQNAQAQELKATQDVAKQITQLAQTVGDDDDAGVRGQLTRLAQAVQMGSVALTPEMTAALGVTVVSPVNQYTLEQVNVLLHAIVGDAAAAPGGAAVLPITHILGDIQAAANQNQKALVDELKQLPNKLNVARVPVSVETQEAWRQALQGAAASIATANNEAIDKLIAAANAQVERQTLAFTQATDAVSAKLSTAATELTAASQAFSGGTNQMLDTTKLLNTLAAELRTEASPLRGNLVELSQLADHIQGQINALRASEAPVGKALGDILAQRITDELKQIQPQAGSALDSWLNDKILKVQQAEEKAREAGQLSAKELGTTRKALQDLASAINKTGVDAERIAKFGGQVDALTVALNGSPAELAKAQQAIVDAREEARKALQTTVAELREQAQQLAGAAEERGRAEVRVAQAEAARLATDAALGRVSKNVADAAAEEAKKRNALWEGVKEQYHELKKLFQEAEAKRPVAAAGGPSPAAASLEALSNRVDVLNSLVLALFEYLGVAVPAQFAGSRSAAVLHAVEEAKKAGGPRVIVGDLRLQAVEKAIRDFTELEKRRVSLSPEQWELLQRLPEREAKFLSDAKEQYEQLQLRAGAQEQKLDQERGYWGQAAAHLIDLVASMQRVGVCTPQGGGGPGAGGEPAPIGDLAEPAPGYDILLPADADVDDLPVGPDAVERVRRDSALRRCPTDRPINCRKRGQRSRLPPCVAAGQEYLCDLEVIDNEERRQALTAPNGTLQKEQKWEFPKQVFKKLTARPDATGEDDNGFIAPYQEHRWLPDELRDDAGRYFKKGTYALYPVQHPSGIRSAAQANRRPSGSVVVVPGVSPLRAELGVIGPLPAAAAAAARHQSAVGPAKRVLEPQEEAARRADEARRKRRLIEAAGSPVNLAEEAAAVAAAVSGRTALSAQRAPEPKQAKRRVTADSRIAAAGQAAAAAAAAAGHTGPPSTRRGGPQGAGAAAVPAPKPKKRRPSVTSQAAAAAASTVQRRASLASEPEEELRLLPDTDTKMTG